MKKNDIDNIVDFQGWKKKKTNHMDEARNQVFREISSRQNEFDCAKKTK